MQTTAKRYRWALGRLKKSLLRLTRQRRLILRHLAGSNTPVPLDELSKDLGNKCDLATIYRTMRRLEHLGVVRQVNLATRFACFTLVAPGECCDYLVCNQCGSVSGLPDAQPVLELEKQIAARSGFHLTRREIEFYGLCPHCQPEPEPACKRTPPAYY